MLLRNTEGLSSLSAISMTGDYFEAEDLAQDNLYLGL